MGRGSDPKKVALWQDRLARHASSGMKTAEFCATEQVTVASFYFWRRRLGSVRQRETLGPRNGFRQVVVTPTPVVLRVQLPGDVVLEVATDQENVLRPVVNELVRTSHRLTDAD